MNWREIADTEIEFRINECLTERPYLQSFELTDRLAAFGVILEIEEVDDILQDPESPYFHEPVRWFLDADHIKIQIPTSPIAAAVEAKRHTAGLVNLEDGLSSIRPTRWIGPVLREWQRNAFMAWVNNDKNGIIEAITGTGKTLVSSGVAERVAVPAHVARS